MMGRRCRSLLLFRATDAPKALEQGLGVLGLWLRFGGLGLGLDKKLRLVSVGFSVFGIRV